MSERGVITAALPPLLIGDLQSGGLTHDAALAVVEDAARVAVREHLPAHEPTPDYLGTWKRWGVGMRSVGRVAFGSPMEHDACAGELVSFQLDALRRISVLLPGETTPQSATLLVGGCTQVLPPPPLPSRLRKRLIRHGSFRTQEGRRVYALGFDRWTSPTYSDLAVSTQADGSARVHLHLSTVPLWARNAAPGEVVNKLNLGMVLGKRGRGD
jgi:hypothetical protein